MVGHSTAVRTSLLLLTGAVLCKVARFFLEYRQFDAAEAAVVYQGLHQHILAHFSGAKSVMHDSDVDESDDASVTVIAGVLQEALLVVEMLLKSRDADLSLAFFERYRTLYIHSVDPRQVGSA